MIVLRRSSGFTWIPRTTSSISLIFFPLDNFDKNVNTGSNLLSLLKELVEKAENKSCCEVSKLAGMMIKASTSWLGISWNRTLFSAIRSDMIVPWHTSQLLANCFECWNDCVESIACMELFYSHSKLSNKKINFISKNKINCYQFDFWTVRQPAIIWCVLLIFTRNASH